MSHISPLHIPEILHQILSSRNIILPSDLLAASLVNKHWFDITKTVRWYEVELDTESWVDPYYQALVTQLQLNGALVRILVLKECGADRARFNKVLSTMTRLQTIVIDRVTLYNCPSFHLRALDSMPLSQLRYLALPRISSSSNGIETLLGICQAAKGLRHLDLIDSELGDADLKAIADACSSVRSLDLSRSELVTFKDFFPVRARQHAHPPWLSLSSSGVAAASTQCVAMTPDSDMHAVQCSQSTDPGPYPQSATPRHDNNISINTHNNNSIFNTADSTSSLDNFPEGQVQQRGGGGGGGGGVGQSVQKYVKRSGAPKSRLLEEDTVFMHLKELSLVFCFGIANAEFQSLFWALCPKSLSALNLQFTHIEDSGLETLAAAGGRTLTSLSVSYCSQITARGIRAVVHNCSALLELEFLSCDQVSADCFLGLAPWACKRLKRLEFTFHPTVLFSANNNNNNNNPTANPGEDNDEPINGQSQEQALVSHPQQQGQTAVATPSTLALSEDRPGKKPKQTPMEIQLCSTGHVYAPKDPLWCHSHQNHDENDDRDSNSDVNLEDGEKESIFQQTQDDPTHGRASIQKEYHAMFRQLKQLSHLRSLHIYNSPLLSGNSGSGDQEFGESGIQGPGMEMVAPTEVAAPSNTPAVVEIEEDPHDDIGSSSGSGSSSGYNSSQDYHVDVSHRVDTEMSAPLPSDDRLEQRIRSRAPTGVQSPGPWNIPLAAFRTTRPGSAGAGKDADATTPIHPFSLRVGMKALGRLHELEALTLYERLPMTVGENEVKWMTKSLPQLVTLQLRGAIEISEHARRRMAARRPSVRVQVCSLFENVCL
ncbi:hypothetical protein EMPS_07957 [Entomortierella parvispora]|uniref:F-box domain-containing protein n=1 Tax=Entomortierella parvispora TaxID=205924 RepID=A0A9P3HF94_9FUNG|nr:hypothetical protein EMPS_07957 [Entomortierella parvispora]